MFYGNETVSLSNNGFYSMDEFLRTLHSGRADNRLINASMVEGIPEFGGYSVPEEYGAFLMDKSWRMKSSVPEQQYGQWEAKQRKYQPSMEQTEPITYSAVFQENGWRKVRQAHERPPS